MRSGKTISTGSSEWNDEGAWSSSRQRQARIYSLLVFSIQVYVDKPLKKLSNKQPLYVTTTTSNAK